MVNARVLCYRTTRMYEFELEESWYFKNGVLKYIGFFIVNEDKSRDLFPFLPVGYPAGLDGFVGCIDLSYLRDSLTNIHIQVLSPGRPSLGRMPHSPFYFCRGRVHISLLCPPSTCVCMCAVNAGGCVIDLLVQGWASTSSLLCLVTGNNANTDNSPVSTSPLCIPLYQAWGMAGGRWKITSETLTLFRRTAPTGNRTRVASVIGQSVTTRPPRRYVTTRLPRRHLAPDV